MSDERIELAEDFESVIKKHMKYLGHDIPEWMDLYELGDRLIDYIPKAVYEMKRETGDI